MNKTLKNLEKLMAHSERFKCANYEAAYKKVVMIFKHIDEKEQSNHCKILNILYDMKTKKMTYVGIANSMHISDNALRRYREDYVEWFNYFLNLVCSKYAA